MDGVREAMKMRPAWKVQLPKGVKVRASQVFFSTEKGQSWKGWKLFV